MPFDRRVEAEDLIKRWNALNADAFRMKFYLMGNGGYWRIELDKKYWTAGGYFAYEDAAAYRYFTDGHSPTDFKYMVMKDMFTLGARMFLTGAKVLLPMEFRGFTIPLDDDEL